MVWYITLTKYQYRPAPPKAIDTMTDHFRWRLSRRDFGRVFLGSSLVASLSPWTEGIPKAYASSGDGLPRSRPDEQSVDARKILDFLDDMSASGYELHSFMLYRHGHVIAEGWWWPYDANRRHMMHSLTKSVTACGVGIALGEGRFSLDDKVISFFKDELPSLVSENLAAMRVRDLLSMQTGHDHETSGSVWRQVDTSWVTEFFNIPVVYRPGTKFVYTSAASFMLSAIVTKTTGQKLRDYLEPRFFKPLGITNLEWDVGPGGINAGGNGLSWTTADALKLAAVHVQNGKWNGKQVLPPAWVHAATSPQVDAGNYGFQWWIGPNGIYYANGMFHQLAFAFPEHDAALAITAAVPDSTKMLPTIWKHFPAVFDTASPTSTHPLANLSLSGRCEMLRVLPPLTPTPHTPPARSPLAKQISGQTYDIEPNEDGVTSVRFDFRSDRCVFTLHDDRGEHTVRNGLKSWIEDDTTMTGHKLHHEYQPDRMRVVAGGRWLDGNTFEMTWQFVESAFRDRVVCRFDGDRMTLDRSVNVNSAATSRPTLTGTLSKAAAKAG